MKITIAGYGTVGHYIENVFGRRHAIVLYDEPKHLGTPSDLIDTDFVFICVPTPPLGDGQIDTTIVEAVVRRSRPRLAIICESTLPIGTTDRMIRDYAKPVVYVPEYAGESPEHPYRDPMHRAFFIYGGYEPSASVVCELFKTVYPESARHDIVPALTAEVVKLAENAFLALKVGFCNELFDLCERLAVPYEHVRDLWAQDERVGRSHTTVTPERGYGGKCLPKDVGALCLTAQQMGVPLDIMEAVQKSNAARRRLDDLQLPVQHWPNGD